MLFVLVGAASSSLFYRGVFDVLDEPVEDGLFGAHPSNGFHIYADAITLGCFDDRFGAEQLAKPVLQYLL